MIFNLTKLINKKIVYNLFLSTKNICHNNYTIRKEKNDTNHSYELIISYNSLSGTYRFNDDLITPFGN